MAGVAYAGVREVLPRDGELARGVLLDGAAVDSSIDDAVAARAEELLTRKVRVSHDGKLLLAATLAELGATVDTEWALSKLRSVGRSGSLAEQLDESWQARHGKISVSLPLRVPVEPLYEALVDYKARFDHKPTPARWDFEAGAATKHEDGQTIDVYATAEAIRRLSREGDMDIMPSILRRLPMATEEAVAAIDQSVVVSEFETRFAFHGGQAGRAQNIARASAGIHGMVMMPGEVVSFNDRVGPRSIDNGFAQAGEIYKGEMRMGIGGGTCQVASTFYAAAWLGAMEVVERSPHSRPSGYIKIGLDATVAYPHVDLKMKNPFEFPVVIRATVVGKGGTLRVEVLGSQRPADVSFASATVGVKPYKRKIREVYWLEEGRVVRKQAGRRGVAIEKVRTIRYGDGTEKVETTVDNYPPTNEVYQVPKGTDYEELLPPLPDGARI